MEQTKKSRFITNKSKMTHHQIRNQNNFQDSNLVHNKNKNLTQIQNNFIVQSQNLKDINKEKKQNNQQNQASKNIWTSSFRDIIRDEPVKVTNIKNISLSPNQKTIKKTPTIKTNPKNNSLHQSSKPVFTISSSLKNSMQKQSPLIKRNTNTNIPETSNSSTKIQKIEKYSSAQIENNNNKPKFVLMEKPKFPQKIINSTNKPTPQYSISNHQSTLISSNRSPSPAPFLSIEHNEPKKNNNKVFKSMSIAIFLFIMSILMIYLPFLL